MMSATYLVKLDMVGVFPLSNSKLTVMLQAVLDLQWCDRVSLHITK